MKHLSLQIKPMVSLIFNKFAEDAELWQKYEQ
jgi:hypothetical protein